MSTNSRKKSKNRNTGRTRGHTKATTCSFTGMPSYPNKAAAEEAVGKGNAKRCGRCRQWH